MHYYGPVRVSSGDKQLYEKHHIYIDRIIPNRIIIKREVYKITYLDKLYFIEGFDVVTENDKVRRVYLYGFHPNRDDNGLYCLPDEKKNQLFTENYFNMLVSNIKTYYYDSCYFKPPSGDIRYKKLKSMYVQLNQGE
ncbi:MAG: hypothetical protein ACFFG0_01915 [Candidatus Thorarchaeota archaeon]